MARLTLDGVAAADLAGRWGVPQCGLFRQLGSTLDAIHELAAQGAPAGTVVVAEEQTAGRGRDGRTWHSPAGGVWLGMLLRPARAELGVMSVRVGLAVADAVDAMLGRVEARLKWPNDVLLAEHKLAGILCEGRWHGETLQWLAVGRARPLSASANAPRSRRVTGCKVASSAHPPPAARAASAPTARCSSISARRRSRCGRDMWNWHDTKSKSVAEQRHEVTSRRDVGP